MGIAPVQYPQSMNLAALNGSDRSLQLLQSYFDDDNGLLLEKASKANFLSQYSKYKVIQLYTHASGSSINGEPVIYFADSALYLSELLEEDIPATSLIVLSACETGSGKWYQGEGVFGFNRGFASVGIPSSITNLWSVDNASTYRITELFYKYLTKGLQLDIALQSAKKEFIKTGSKENELPYYWAGAILAGKTDSIDLVKGFNWKYTIIGFLLVGLVVVGFLFWRKNKIRVTYVRRTGENVM
jgi:CHAT domain-containing protein